MIAKSQAYKLVVGGIVVAAGSAKEMRRLRKQAKGGKEVAVWLTDTPIGGSVYRSCVNCGNRHTGVALCPTCEEAKSE